MTATRASQLISHLTLTLTTDLLWIKNAEFGAEFIKSVIQRVTIFKNLWGLYIYDASLGGDGENRQEAGVRLANVLATNTTITELCFKKIDLIGSNNVAQLGDALMRNKILTELWLDEVGADIKDELKAKTKGRTPDLWFNFI